MTLLSLFSFALSVASLILSLVVRRSYGKTIKAYRRSIEVYRRARQADTELIESQDRLIRALTRSEPRQSESERVN